jgi:hypothetical protein
VSNDLLQTSGGIEHPAGFSANQDRFAQTCGMLRSSAKDIDQEMRGIPVYCWA